MKMLTFLAFPLLLVAGCAQLPLSKGVDVTHFTAEGADLGAMRSWSWVPLSETIDTAAVGQDTLISMKIAFTDALEKRGYPRTDADPDLLVALYLSREGRIQSTDWGYDYGWDKMRWDGYWMESRVSTREYEQGTLVLDLLDNRKKELVWSGTATAVLLPGASGESRNKRIDEAVEKLLSGLPPKTE